MELNEDFFINYENLMSENVEEALDYCEEMLEKLNNPDIYAYIGDCLMSLERFEEAISHFNKGISLGCNNRSFAISLKGEALFYLEKYEESKEIFVTLFRENPNSFFVVAYLTDIDIKLGNYLEGIDRAENIILNGNLDQEDLAHVEANKGWIYLKYLNNIDKAYESFSKALEFSSETAIVYVGFGEYYLQRGEYLRAIENYEKAIDFGEGTMDVYYNIALSYKGLKKYEDSLEYFKIVMQVDENFKDVCMEINKIQKLII